MELIFLLTINLLFLLLIIAPEGMYPRGIRDVFAKLYKEEGLKALYAGVTPVMLRAFPANAACFLGVEYGLKGLNFIFPPTKHEDLKSQTF